MKLSGRVATGAAAHRLDTAAGAASQARQAVGGNNHE